MKNQYIAAKTEGKNIALIDKSGYRANYASAAGLAHDEVFTAANLNGNYLVGTTSKNTVITWDVTTTPCLISRR